MPKLYGLAEGEDESRDVKQVTTELSLTFGVSGAATKEEAWGYLYSNIPRVHKGMAFTGARSTGFNDEMWEFVANYKKASDSQSDDDGDEEAQISFDCSGGTTHIIKSQGQKKHGTNAPDAGGFIGWNGKTGQDCSIAGTDVVSSTMRESYTKYIRRSRLNTNFKRTLARLTGKVNNSSFKGWSRGEVLFLGANFQGADKGSEKIGVVYNFAIQENEDEVDVGGVSISKRGWEYVWSISQTTEKDGKIQLVTLGVYVDAVYREVNFGALGL